MVSRYKQERLDELDMMLRSAGVHLETYAERWGVLPERVREYLHYLQTHNGKVVSRLTVEGEKTKPLYYYAETLNSMP